MRKLVFTLIALVLFSSAANAAVKWNNSSGNKNKNIPNGNCEERFSAELKEPESVPWVEGWSFEESFEEEEELNVPSYLQFTEAKEVNGGREHSQPVVRAVADFDGDGFDDFLIVFHETRRHASIVYSDGAGGMKLVDLPASTTRRLVREVSLADFNGDGLIDIYGHTAPHDWRTGWRDVDGVSNENYGQDEEDLFLLNLGERNFRSVDLSQLTNTNNHQGAIADFNLDGKLDVFSQPQKSKQKRFVLYNQDGENFEKGKKTFSDDFGKMQYWDAEAGDLNADGYPDLVLSIQHFKSNPDYLKQNGSIALMINDGGSIETGKLHRFGEFWTSEKEWKDIISFLSCIAEEKNGELYGTSAFAGEIKLFDFNDDGNPDIFFSQLASGHFEKGTKEFGNFLRYFENDGQGNFADKTSEIFPHQELNKVFSKPVGRPIAIHFADISGDGVEDLILQNIGSRYSELEWSQYPYIYIRSGNRLLPVTKNIVGDLYWRNQIFPADLNGDGKVDLVSMRYDKKESNRYQFTTYLRQ